MVRGTSRGLPQETKGGMELNYPIVPQFALLLAGTQNAQGHSWTGLTGTAADACESPPISLILGMLRCDKISIHTDPLRG